MVCAPKSLASTEIDGGSDLVEQIILWSFIEILL